MARSAGSLFSVAKSDLNGRRGRTPATFVVLLATALGIVLLPALSMPAGAATSAWQVSASFPVSQAVLGDVACPSPTECIAVGNVGGGSGFNGAVIEGTTDGGATWTTQSVPSSVASASTTGLQSIACPSPSDCYAGGSSSSLGDFILGTTNGGATWSVQDTPNGYGGMPAVSCPSTNDCYALADSGAAGFPSLLVATTSGGSGWTNLALPPNLPQLDGLSCQTVQSCFVVGGGDVFRTTNGGSSWTSERLGGLPPGQGSVFNLDRVTCMSSSTCLTAGGNFIFRTTDSGTTWTAQNVALTGVADIACTSALDCFAGGSQGGAASLLGTLDGGASWTSQALTPFAGSIAGLSSASATTTCFAVENGAPDSVILKGPQTPLALTTTTVAATPSPVPQGQSVLYTATVQPKSGTGAPAGTVAFTAGSTTLCTATLSNGVGSCPATNAPVGSDTVTGTYSGDSSFQVSSGSTTVVVQSPSVTSIHVQPSSAALGQQVTYVATVTSGQGTGTPTGTVSFANGRDDPVYRATDERFGVVPRGHRARGCGRRDRDVFG